MRGRGEKWGSDSERRERCYVGIKAEIGDIWKRCMGEGAKVESVEEESGAMKEERQRNISLKDYIFFLTSLKSPTWHQSTT